MTGNRPQSATFHTANRYAPLSISAPSSSSHSFISIYREGINQEETDYPAKYIDGTLSNADDSRLWGLLRYIGTSTPTITLNWGSNNACALTDPANLKLAQWDYAASKFTTVETGHIPLIR
ncbi:MAG: hypothetical protein K1X82_02285 [Bacteroidia bacterium]|nr:hypothetical protein [Bacteroidia bacterium]